MGFIIGKNGKPQGKKDDAVLSYAHALYAYAKTKQYMLGNLIESIQDPDVHPAIELELEKRYNTEKMKSLNYGKTQLEIDTYLAELEQESNFELNKEESGELTRFKTIWSAFY